MKSGNRTNEENWAAQERLRSIERAAWWRGWVGRNDLVEVFGISRAQASSDLQKYQVLNPGSLNYHMSRKRYEGAAEMQCVLHEPTLEEGMSAFLGGEYASPARVGELGNRIGTVGLPNRRGRQGVERVMLMAVAEGLRIQVRYWSVNSGKASWRWLRPHAFGHDGYRWHVRAWCEQREKFLDFVLGRIEKTEWPDENDEDKKKLPVDEDWQRVVVVKVRANGMLSEQAQRAIELDYGIRKKGGVLKLKVRKAMEGYLLDHLRIGREGGDLPRHFELCDE